jgi:cell fate regulator YaaT (PSP1 superfamily)
MGKLVGVRFRPGDKLFYFDAGDETTLQVGDRVVVETPHNLEILSKLNRMRKREGKR